MDYTIDVIQHRLSSAGRISYTSYAPHSPGYHDETRMRVHTHTDKDGHSHTRTEHYTETVTDFKFSIDASDYVAHRSHTGLYVLPQPEPLFAWFLGWFKPKAERELEIARREQVRSKTTRELCNEFV